MRESEPAVLIVHAIDTEGPLHEPLGASFERLEELFEIPDLPRTRETLAALAEGRIDLGGREGEVQSVISGHRLNYMDSWAKLDAMLDRVTARDFRRAMVDSYGGGWVYNWFCLDHVGFETNPRRRTMGYHAIHDHYVERLAEDPDTLDEIQWHFHPMSTYREAHRCGTFYFRTPHVYEILARRIIERRFFPSAFRAGFQTERPDSHWFLEQWIPFDLSNTSVEPSNWTDAVDLRNGRSADWRRAPRDWSVYRPSHDDYQRRGDCRRWIGRALNVLNRFANLDEAELAKAFEQVRGGRSALVGVASHDFRDLGPEVDHVRQLLARVASRFPDVKFKFCRVRDAFRRAADLDMDAEPPLGLKIEVDAYPTDDVPNLTVTAEAGSVFGPQPFLAIETMGRRFLHDNLDFGLERGTWHYAFHGDTLPIDDVRRVGVGASDRFGRTSIEIASMEDIRAR